MGPNQHGKAAKRLGGLTFRQLKWSLVITVIGSAAAWYFAPLQSPRWAIVMSVAIGAFAAQLVASAMGVED